MQEEYMKLLERYRRECEYAGALKSMIEQAVFDLKGDEDSHTGQAVARQISASLEWAKREYGE